MRSAFAIGFLILILFLEKGAVAFEIKSDVFEQESNIPSEYTCAGKNLSPALQWQDPPSQTKSFALIADDPDAPMGTWVHWVLYDIPAETSRLESGVSNSETLPDGSKQGLTDFGRTSYGGPCPPSGKHRYYFKLYALDQMLNLPPKRKKTDLLKAMEGHILAEAELMGYYQRKR